MKTPAVILLVIALISCQQEGFSQKNAVNYWGEDLQPGQYDVGFRTLFTYDKSRPAIPLADWDGNLTFNQEDGKGRQMQINVWYPAKGKGRPIQYGHYIHLLGRQTNFSANDSATIDLAKKIFIEQTNALGGNGNFTGDQFAHIAKLKTHAYLQASPVDKKFPLLLFPNGGSPAYQSIMCEYFASHGYVVAAVALKGQFSSTLDVSARGLEIGADDLQYTLNQLLELDNVDRNHIGLMGNAIESSMCTALAAKNKLIKALISLEGGLLSRFEQRLLKETNFYTPSAIHIPILAIYAPHPAISPSFINHLQYSRRYFIHFPGMTEFHFLNYGLLEQESPNIIGPPKGDSKAGFEWAAKLSLKFLDAMLKDKVESKTFFDEFEIPQAASGVIDTAYALPALPSPPNTTLLKNLFITKGMQAIDSIYQSLQAEDPQVFPLSFYTEFRDWLAWKKDPDYHFRAQLYDMAIEGFPKSAVAHYYRAYYAEKMGERQLAREHYQLALDMISEDEDPTLTKNKRKILQEEAHSALSRL